MSIHVYESCPWLLYPINKEYKNILKGREAFTNIACQLGVNTVEKLRKTFRA